MPRRVIRQIETPGGGAPLQVLEGRYGPYVTDGETNASIPRGMDLAALSLDEARGLLDARRGAPSRAPRGRRAAAPKGRPVRAAKTVAPPVVTKKVRAARPRAKRKTANRKTVH